MQLKGVQEEGRGSGIECIDNAETKRYIVVLQRIYIKWKRTKANRPRVHIDGGVWHLDVGSSHPGAEVGPKGMAVRHLKWYASWV